MKMMTIQKYDMELVSEEAMNTEYDCFILAPNIEKRSRALFASALDKDVFKHIIIANYDFFHKELNVSDEKSFFDIFAGTNSTIVDIHEDSDLLRQMDGMNINCDNRIALDITGFSIPSIYRIMRYLKNKCKIKNIDVFYTEPKHYIYEEGYFDSYHRNIKSRVCAPIPGFVNSGRNQKEILIILLGFDGGLADLVYGKLGEEGKEIIRTIVINGFPSYTAKLKDVSLYNNEGLINKLNKNDLKAASANNPFDTYNMLCKIKQETGDILLNLCSIGSKPMALGACLFALDNNEDCKVTYPFYTKTKFDFSEETGKIWCYRIDWM